MDESFLHSPTSLENFDLDSMSQNGCNLSGYLKDFELDFNQNSALSPSLTLSSYDDDNDGLSQQADLGVNSINNDCSIHSGMSNSYSNHSYETDSLQRLKSDTLSSKTAPFRIRISQSAVENRRRNYSVGDSNSKNAIAARDNRLKKKKYIAELEKTVEVLRADNEILSKEVHKNKEQMTNLENEVKYLKSVIANQSTLSAILSSVSKTQGVSLSTSFFADNMNAVDVSDRNLRHTKSKSKTVNTPLNLKPQRNLRSQSKISPSFKSEASKSGVHNMTPKEIIQCCKDKEKTRRLALSQTNCENSETDSDMEDGIIDVDDSTSPINSQMPEDFGGVCLHVTGQKVSLEFCSACNVKCNTNVSLDHPYFRK